MDNRSIGMAQKSNKKVTKKKNEKATTTQTAP
jgi:hypothetical protein